MGDAVRGASRPRAVTLPLPLPLEPPAPPRRLELEEATVCAADFSHPDWRFSVDWDGVRVVLAAGSDASVHVHDERLRDLSARLPELATAARHALGGRSAVIEGTLALLDENGCPDLAGLQARLVDAGARAPVTGLVLLATDLLHLDGVPVLSWPWERRRTALSQVLRPAPHIQLPDVVSGEGRAVATAARRRGLGGVLARHAQAPYLPGLMAPHRLRIPSEERADVVVVGVAGGSGRGAEIGGLMLAEWDGGRLVDAGRAAAPLDAAVQRWLRGRVAVLRTPDCPVPTLRTATDVSGVTWVTPSVVATVRHHGRGADGAPRLPSPMALREDRPVRWCLRREPVAAPSGQIAVSGRAFRPTVIRTLPLG